MYVIKRRRQSDPVWWSMQHSVVWEARRSELRRAFEQGADAQPRTPMKRLGPDDAVIQMSPRTPRNVGIDRAHAVPDDSWEVGSSWEQTEPALRFGVGARVQFSRYEAWTVELEGVLREEWEATNGRGTWQRVRRAIQRGFEAARRGRS